MHTARTRECPASVSCADQAHAPTPRRDAARRPRLPASAAQCPLPLCFVLAALPAEDLDVSELLTAEPCVVLVVVELEPARGRAPLTSVTSSGQSHRSKIAVALRLLVAHVNSFCASACHLCLLI